MSCPTKFAVSYRTKSGETVSSRDNSPVDAIWEIGRTLDSYWLERSIMSLQLLLGIRQELEERERASEKIRIDALLATI